MNIKDFLDLPEDVRQEMVDTHNRSKQIRQEMQTLKKEEGKLNNRKLNIQLECKHPYKKMMEYRSFQNEFGIIVGGQYNFYCPDCDKRWSSKYED